jgi:hypothetical protein
VGTAERERERERGREKDDEVEWQVGEEKRKDEKRS